MAAAPESTANQPAIRMTSRRLFMAPGLYDPFSGEIDGQSGACGGPKVPVRIHRRADRPSGHPPTRAATRAASRCEARRPAWEPTTWTALSSSV